MRSAEPIGGARGQLQQRAVVVYRTVGHGFGLHNQPQFYPDLSNLADENFEQILGETGEFTHRRPAAQSNSPNCPTAISLIKYWRWLP